MKVLITGSSGLVGSEAVAHSLKYVDQPRVGDHICFISDLTKLKTHFPNWKIRVLLDDILERMCESPVLK